MVLTPPKTNRKNKLEKKIKISYPETFYYANIPPQITMFVPNAIVYVNNPVLKNEIGHVFLNQIFKTDTNRFK